LGRITYQSFARAWPTVPDNPSVSEGEKAYARKLNAMQKIVFSKSLQQVEWANSRLVKDHIEEEAARLKQEPGKDMLIYGSASIVQALTNSDLIDEYQLLIYPVILGSGKPLFKDIRARANLTLVNSTIHPSGVALLTYQQI